MPALSLSVLLVAALAVVSQATFTPAPEVTSSVRYTLNTNAMASGTIISSKCYNSIKCMSGTKVVQAISNCLVRGASISASAYKRCAAASVSADLSEYFCEVDAVTVNTEAGFEVVTIGDDGACNFNDPTYSVIVTAICQADSRVTGTLTYTKASTPIRR